MTLAALQRTFQSFVIGGGALSDGAVADARGMPVYANAYRATLRDCLRDAYARTLAWLGEDAFGDLSDTFALARPPVSWTLGDYGEGLAEHIGVCLPDAPEAAELAWLEWRLRGAFSASAGARPLQATLLAADWETVVLRIADHADARVVAYDLPAIWAAIDRATAPECLVLAEPAGLVVWRDGLTPRFRTTSVLEATALAQARAGVSFAMLCATAASTHGASPADMGALLARWLADGLIVGLD